MRLGGGELRRCRSMRLSLAILPDTTLLMTLVTLLTVSLFTASLLVVLSPASLLVVLSPASLLVVLSPVSLLVALSPAWMAHLCYARGFARFSTAQSNGGGKRVATAGTMASSIGVDASRACALYVDATSAYR